MPYRKVYNRDIYLADAKYLLLKIREEGIIKSEYIIRCNRIYNLSVIFEILTGILSTTYNLNMVKYTRTKDGRILISTSNYRTLLEKKLGYEFYFVIEPLSKVRNAASHTFSNMIDNYDSYIEYIDFVHLIKFILEIQKKSGMGREIAVCVYDMFKENIDIKDLFNDADEYKHFETQLNGYMKESEFELALDYLLLRS